MKSAIKYALIVSTATAVMMGCGGSDNNNNEPSPYAGTWSGTWVGAEAVDGGTLSLTITADGSIAGTMGRKGGLSGAVAGVVKNTGQFKAATAFPTSGNFTELGAMTSSGGGLNGNFSYNWLGVTYTATFTASAPSATTAGSTAGQ